MRTKKQGLCSAGERRKRTQRDRRIQEIGAMLTAAMQATVLTDRLPGTLISIYIQVSRRREVSYLRGEGRAGVHACSCLGLPCHRWTTGTVGGHVRSQDCLAACCMRCADSAW